MDDPAKADLPAELLDAHLLRVLGVPLASSYLELQRVPALLVRQQVILAGGYQDAAEWAEIKAERGKSKT